VRLPRERGAGSARAAAEHGRIDIGASTMMNSTVAANDAFLRPANESIRDDGFGIDVPKGHVGPVLLSETGRTVWWTGRVAIGLRYEPPRRSETFGQSALWLQAMLLKCG
jgi:hypothetical protein